MYTPQRRNNIIRLESKNSSKAVQTRTAHSMSVCMQHQREDNTESNKTTHETDYEC